LNKKNQIKKGLVIGVLLLFITTSVVPTINGDNDIHRYSNNSMNLQKYFIGCQGDEWNKTYGGSHKDHGNAGQQTSDGGYIITGETFSYGPGHYDVWLIKTDLYGNEEWNTTFGGDQSDGGFSVCQTTDGGYIVAGYTNSFSIPVATPDILLIKTDDLGNEEWMKTYGGHQYESTRCVQQTTDEGYILFGYTSSYGAGNGDCWLIKTDENGNVTWDKTYGGSEPDACYSGHQTLDNGYILVGFTGSYGVENDIWLIKTDENGDEEWNKTFGENDYDEGISVHQTTDLGYIITGTTSSYAAQKSDVILIKTDADGNEDWHTLYGTSSWDHGNSVQQTIDG